VKSYEFRWGSYDHIRSCGNEAWCASAIILLLEHGASLDIEDEDGLLAIDYAMEIAKLRYGKAVAIDILRCLLGNVKSGCISEEEEVRGKMAIAELLIEDESVRVSQDVSA